MKIICGVFGIAFGALVANALWLFNTDSRPFLLVTSCGALVGLVLAIKYDWD